MKAVAAMVTSGGVLADVGTDHGYIPIALIQRQKIKSAIAMDINKGPLARAQDNIASARLGDYIQTRLSDGVAALGEGEADSILIAGMGGELVIHILSEGEKVCKAASELILQPQSDIRKVREYLRLHHYKIVDEDMICEDGKYYAMMRVKHGKMTPLTEIEQKYGPVLLAKKDPVLKEFLEREERKFTEIREHLAQMEGEKAAFRKKEVEKELEDIRAAKERLD